jgi:hypothetical protein
MFAFDPKRTFVRVRRDWFVTNEISPMKRSDVNEELEQLVNAWCDRRAIGPLRVILGCYPINNDLTDDWAAAVDGLKTVRVRHVASLTAGEMDAVVRLQHLLETAVSERP